MSIIKSRHFIFFLCGSSHDAGCRELCVRPEKPVFPAVRRDPHISAAAPRGSDTGSGNTSQRPHRLLHTTEQEDKGCEWRPCEKKSTLMLYFKFFQIVVVSVLQKRNHELSTLSEVARVPKGAEWLWHPQIVGLYNQVLQNCEMNNATREAAAGALQNITAGDGRVRRHSSAYPQSLKYFLIAENSFLHFLGSA